MNIRLPPKESFRLGEAARHCDVHVSTVVRWALKGVRGHVLKTYLVGGRRFVGRDDLLAFFAAVNGPAAGVPVIARLDAGREQALADDELDRSGF